MSNDVRVALIGLDTSHTIQFAQRMQAPDCPPDQKVQGLRAVSCLRFGTPFQDKAGLDERQAQLEAWGVPVTTDFDEAVADCDAVMLEINDPAYHLEYFKKCIGLGKPMFLDKPLADNIQNGRTIVDLTREKNARMFSASSLRFVPGLERASEAMPAPKFGSTFGPLGIAPAGSSIVWYGVHAFEMLQRAMGPGAESVFARRDKAGVVAMIQYSDGRRGVVELTEGAWVYGGWLRTDKEAVPFTADSGRLYAILLEHIADFFRGGESPVPLEDTLEIMSMLDATESSTQSGKPEKV